MDATEVPVAVKETITNLALSKVPGVGPILGGGFVIATIAGTEQVPLVYYVATLSVLGVLWTISKAIIAAMEKLDARIQLSIDRSMAAHDNLQAESMRRIEADLARTHEQYVEAKQALAEANSEIAAVKQLLLTHVVPQSAATTGRHRGTRG